MNERLNKAQFKLFLKFLRLLFPYKKKQIIVLSLSGASVLLGLANPYLGKLAVDNGIMNKQLKTFIVLGFIGTGIFILNGLIKAVEGFLERSIRLRVSFDLNRRVFGHLQGLPLDFFKNKSTGENLFTVNYDVERVVDIITSAPRELVNIFPRLIFILIIIFYLDWQMAVFSLILMPILYLPNYYFTRRMRKVWEDLLNSSQKIFRRLVEAFSHMYLVKAFGKERQEIRNYLKVLISNIRISLKNTRLEVFSSFAGGSFDRLIIGLISLFGGYQVIRGRISLGTLTAIMIYLNQLIGMQGSITSFFQRIIFNMVSCRRIEEVLEKASEKENRPGTEKIALEHPQIQFKKLSFGYNSGEYILRGLDFKIDKGSVALAGPSGCGKTTIINLLLGLYEPWEGQVFIQGQNIRDINHFLLREEIGVALQEPYLWNDSIENNIKYARQNATKGELTEVAKITGVDEFVKNLPAGYGSIIGENACKLSEGQKQKIAIARALLKKPKILILDEAMSSMDSLSEERIINEIKKESWIHTVIIVSHRLSTIMACDLAYFLKNPDKIIIDNPQKLLDTDGDFYNLFAAQIKEPLLKDAVNPLVQSIPE